MIYHLAHIKDVIGNNYIGINITNDLVNSFLNELKELLGEVQFSKYTESQKIRDSSKYHLTVINVMDYNKLSKNLGLDNFVNSLDKLFDYEIDDLQLLGLGTAEKSTNRSYFVVCRSKKLDIIRERYSLEPQDFHITLGFYPKDVFGVRKNIILKKNSKFIQLLGQEYLKKENFEFLRKINSWEDNPDSQIIPITISDNYLKIKVGDYLMDIGINDENNFCIFTRYIDKENLPRMSTSELLSILIKKNN